MRINTTTILLATILLLLQVLASAQSCYIRLTDASGINTDTYQPMLEAAACSLRAVFPSEFQQSFKVYDVGFYLHNTVTAGYPQVFEMARNDVDAQSPYYLLFGKQTDKMGIYTRFWVDLKLPTTGKFECIDLLSPTLRGDIKKKIEYVTVTTYAHDGNQFSQYALAEATAMAALQKIVADFVECCDLQARNAESTNACNAFIFPADLKEVTYSGEHYIEMKQDGDNDFGQPFPKPHFLSSQTASAQSPLACVSGFSITAATLFSGNEIFETIMIRGKGETQVSGVPITINFAKQIAAQDAVSKQITANLTGQLPYMAVFLDDLKIKWEMKVKKAGEPQGDWEPVGECVNDWYLTLKHPIAEESGKGYLHFHTLFDISCRYGKGYSDLEMASGVWGHFASRQVKRADGQPLKYYGQWSGGNLAAKTSELIMLKDGECTAWARIFLDVLKVHGFKEDDNIVTVKAVGSSGFFIKEWQKIPVQGSFPNTEYPYKNVRGTPPYNSNNTYNWEYAEVTLKKSSESQNNNNPRSDFDRHRFAKIKGVLYDASYGVSYGSPSTIQIPSVQFPGQFDDLQEIRLLDNVVSAYYSQYPGNLLKIKLNDSSTIRLWT